MKDRKVEPIGIGFDALMDSLFGTPGKDSDLAQQTTPGDTEDDSTTDTPAHS